MFAIVTLAAKKGNLDDNEVPRPSRKITLRTLNLLTLSARSAKKSPTKLLKDKDNDSLKFCAKLPIMNVEATTVPFETASSPLSVNESTNPAASQLQNGVLVGQSGKGDDSTSFAK
jgi:hypothetical protein